MMETFLNSLSESFGWSDHLPAIRVFKNIISSGVQAAYLIFSRAVLSLASFSDCVLCLIFFLGITTVVTKQIPIRNRSLFPLSIMGSVAVRGAVGPHILKF